MLTKVSTSSKLLSQLMHDGSLFFAPKEQANPYAELVPKVKSILDTINEAEVDHLSTEEAQSHAEIMEHLSAIFAKAAVSLNSVDVKSFDKGSQVYNDFIYVRNSFSNIITAMKELQESYSLMADKAFRDAYGELSSGDFSNFVKA